MKHFATLKRIFGCIALLLIAQISFAQVQVTGNVVDEQGESLIGVSVMVEGTVIGIQTDIDGNFELSVPSQSSVLEFSYIGYTTQTAVVGARTNFSIVMTEDSQMIDDVVVVGYGVQKKSHLTGSVSQYDGEKLADMAVTSVDQALQGRIAGVNITNTTSEAGETPQIRVRGMGSISASNEPLIIVDGYPSSDGLQMVDMNDVASIEVLKDAASAAIYGSRGANGVIIITTKSGNSSEPKYTVKAYTGVKSAYALHDLLGNEEYIDLLYDEYYKGGPSISSMSYLYEYFIGKWEETDWQQVGLNDNAKINSLSFGVSGGSDKSDYYISASYVGDDGIMKNSAYDKFNVRFKFNTKLSDAVDIGINIAPTYTFKEKNSQSFRDFYRTYSWLPVYHDEGTYEYTGCEPGTFAHAADFNKKYFEYYTVDGLFKSSSSQNAWNTTDHNPYYRMINDKIYYETYALQMSAYLNIQLAEGLTFRTSNNAYYNHTMMDRYHNADCDSAGDANYAILYGKKTVDLLTENTLNYNKEIGKHAFSVLLGYTANIKNVLEYKLYGTDFPTDEVPTLNAATAISLTDTYSEEEEEALVSVLGRLTYSYDDKYLLSAAARADGSSKFGPENQWGSFPSVSLGWRASEEDFMKKYSDIVNQVKVRASWGITGTNDIDNYAAYNTLSGADYVFSTTNTSTAGLANTSDTLGNTYICWEQTSEFNYGLDLSFLNSRINITADYYYKVTQSLLLEQSSMAITGFTNYWNNIGRVRNKGFEFDINTYNIDKPNFTWTTNFNIAFNDNLLLELSDTQDELITTGSLSELYIAKVGEQAIQFYGYVSDGVWMSQDEIDNCGLEVNVGSTPAPGTMKIADTNGDNIVDANDRTVIGDPFADYTWGMTNTFRYKNFDFSFQLYGSMGGELMNGDGSYTEMKKIGNSWIEGRFVSEEYPGDGVTPNYNISGGYTSWALTDYVIQDATFITLRDVSLGYSFGKDALSKLHLSKLRLYATAQNLFYWWTDDYKGLNPEARLTTGTYDNPLIAGAQYGAFPISKTVTVGIEINF